MYSYYKLPSGSLGRCAARKEQGEERRGGDERGEECGRRGRALARRSPRTGGGDEAEDGGGTGSGAVGGQPGAFILRHHRRDPILDIAVGTPSLTSP